MKHSIRKNFGDASVPDVDQLSQFLEDIARFKAEEKRSTRCFQEQKISIGWKPVLDASMKKPSPLETSDVWDTEDEEESDLESFSTICDGAESVGSWQYDEEEDQDMKLYAELLIEHKETQEHEEEWIREVNQKLMDKVRDSLVNLKACQLLAEALQGHGEKTEEKQERRSSSAVMLEMRRASAAEIRRQSSKAAKKVKRAKTRQLKARQALVNALKKHQQEKIKQERAEKKQQKRKWDRVKRSARLEFEKNLESMKQKVQI